MENYDIFISYKRIGASNYVASYIYSFLKGRGYSVFLDREEMKSGEFNKQIYEHIENAKDIIILLEEGSLKSIANNSKVKAVENFSDAFLENRTLLKWMANKSVEAGKSFLSKFRNYKGDWFCMEIMHAIENGKNIIPVLLNGYKMPSANTMPEEMSKLPFCQAIDYDPRNDFEDVFQRYDVANKYLKAKESKTKQLMGK